LTFEKARKLLAHFDTSTPKGRRDIAMCALFLDSGLRVSEIARLELKYIYLDERLLTVIVKGGDWGTAGYSPRTKQYLIDWLEVRSGIAKRSITAFFVGIGGTTPGEKMTRDGIKVIVKKWGIDSGIGALSPHDFRRSFATLGTLLGGPQRVMMIGGRWKDQTTFERYIQEITIKDLDPYYPVPAIIGRV
jgi:site-specific recombinase XerC